MTTRTMRNYLTVIAVVFLSGCISQQETVYRDVDRAKVEFESEAAGRIFYETLSKRGRVNREEQNTAVSLPIVFEHKRKVVRSENFEFNDAVAKCDTNKDGKITETEARIFSQLKSI